MAMAMAGASREESEVELGWRKSSPVRTAESRSEWKVALEEEERKEVRGEDEGWRRGSSGW